MVNRNFASGCFRNGVFFSQLDLSHKDICCHFIVVGLSLLHKQPTILLTFDIFVGFKQYSTVHRVTMYNWAPR